MACSACARREVDIVGAGGEEIFGDIGACGLLCGASVRIGIVIVIYLMCFLPGGNSAHSIINSTNQQEVQPTVIMRKTGHTRYECKDWERDDQLLLEACYVLYEQRRVRSCRI